MHVDSHGQLGVVSVHKKRHGYWTQRSMYNLGRSDWRCLTALHHGHVTSLGQQRLNVHKRRRCGSDLGNHTHSWWFHGVRSQSRPDRKLGHDTAKEPGPEAPPPWAWHGLAVHCGRNLAVAPAVWSLPAGMRGMLHHRSLLHEYVICTSESGIPLNPIL